MRWTPRESRTLEAVFERLFPAGGGLPGATDIGVVAYVDRALAGAYRDRLETYRSCLPALDRSAVSRFGKPFCDCAEAEQDVIVTHLEQGALEDPSPAQQLAFFALLRAHLQEGLFADPAHKTLIRLPKGLTPDQAQGYQRWLSTLK